MTMLTNIEEIESKLKDVSDKIVEVKKMLSEKFPEWKVSAELDRFIRKGYLSEDEEGVLYLGWRTKAEVDLKALLESIAGGQVS